MTWDIYSPSLKKILSTIIHHDKTKRFIEVYGLCCKCAASIIASRNSQTIWSVKFQLLMCQVQGFRFFLTWLLSYAPHAYNTQLKVVQYLCVNIIQSFSKWLFKYGLFLVSNSCSPCTTSTLCLSVMRWLSKAFPKWISRCVPPKELLMLPPRAWFGFTSWATKNITISTLEKEHYRSKMKPIQ